MKQNYNHYNRTLGMQIRSKDHYDKVCKERGMVPIEQAQEMAEKGRIAKIKPYELSKESEEIIKYAHQIKDTKGNLKLGDKAIKALIDKKAIGKVVPDYMKLPSVYSGKGGFS